MKATPKFSDSGNWSFDFNCYHLDEDLVKKGWAFRLPTGSWAPNMGNGGKELLEKNALHFFSLVSKNSEGWAITVDDTIGDERYRQRRLFYCMARESKAICGESVLGYIEFIENKRNFNPTPYALRMLREIEFLEDAAPTSDPSKR
ncbi:hypothetical protein [Variovorax sp. RO1]|uniref:hypothetical protein n=1 Tax=Variovorax sp. RO1 TaxID=2066034 RepID=UPI00117E3783|nr:hypothetical protein [Variovorax sp. RO1]